MELLNDIDGPFLTMVDLMVKQGRAQGEKYRRNLNKLIQECDNSDEKNMRLVDLLKEANEKVHKAYAVIKHMESEKEDIAVSRQQRDDELIINEKLEGEIKKLQNIVNDLTDQIDRASTRIARGPAETDESYFSRVNQDMLNQARLTKIAFIITTMEQRTRARLNFQVIGTMPADAMMGELYPSEIIDIYKEATGKDYKG